MMNVKDVEKIPWTELVSNLITDVGSSFYSSWFIMLVFGIAHSTDHAIPAFGYWTCFWILVIFNFLFGDSNSGTRRQIKRITGSYF